MPTPTASAPSGTNAAASIIGTVHIDGSALTGTASDYYSAAYNSDGVCIGVGSLIAAGPSIALNFSVNNPDNGTDFTLKIGYTGSNTTTFSHDTTYTWVEMVGGGFISGLDNPGKTYNFTQDTGGGGNSVPTASAPSGTNAAASIIGTVHIDGSALTGTASDYYSAAYNSDGVCIGVGSLIAAGPSIAFNFSVNNPDNGTDFTLKIGYTGSNTTTFSHDTTYTWVEMVGGGFISGLDNPGKTYNFTQDTGGGGGGADSEKPVINSGTTGTNLVENVGPGKTIYTIAATDNVAVTGYAIDGTDASLLSVDATSGVVTLTANPNYENKSSYSFDVTATDGTNTSDPVTVTFSISDANDPTTGIPAITSNGNTASPLVGDTLTATQGNIADPDGVGAFSYQWKNSSGATVIGTSSTYTIQQTDKDYTITVSVTFNDGGNNPVGPLTSSATGTVTAPNSVAAGLTITGTASEGGTLTANVDTIVDADGLPGSYTYQWKRDDSAISGATNSTYTVASDDVGKTITVTVSFQDNKGYDESLTSNPVTVAALDDKIYFWTEYNGASNNTAIHYAIYNTTKVSGVQFTYDVSGSTTVADVSYSIVDNSNNNTAVYKKEWLQIINNTTSEAYKSMLFWGNVNQTLNGMVTGTFAIIGGNVTLDSVLGITNHLSENIATTNVVLAEPQNPPTIENPGGRILGDLNFDASLNNTDADIMSAYLLNDTDISFNTYDSNGAEITPKKTAQEIIDEMMGGEWLEHVDINANGHVDVGDLVRILSKIADPNFNMSSGL